MVHFLKSDMKTHSAMNHFAMFDTVNNQPCSCEWYGKEMACSDGKSNSKGWRALKELYQKHCQSVKVEAIFKDITFTFAALFSSAAAPKTTMTRTKDMTNSIPNPYILCQHFASWRKIKAPETQ